MPLLGGCDPVECLGRSVGRHSQKVFGTASNITVFLPIYPPSMGNFYGRSQTPTLGKRVRYNFLLSSVVLRGEFLVRRINNSTIQRAEMWRRFPQSARIVSVGDEALKVKYLCGCGTALVTDNT